MSYVLSPSLDSEIIPERCVRDYTFVKRVGILGFHSFRSLLRNFANNKASSLISVSNVCLLPCLIRGISTLRSKSLFRPSAKPLVSYSQRCMRAHKHEHNFFVVELLAGLFFLIVYAAVCVFLLV